MKKRYVIEYTGVFESGYVTLTLTKKHGSILKSNNDYFAICNATKFRFKWAANFWCWSANLDSKHNYNFRTFKVKKIIV